MAENVSLSLTSPYPVVHKALAEWAAVCADRVLPIFERLRPEDDRPRIALATLRAWIRDEEKMTVCRTAAFGAHAAARDALAVGDLSAGAAARAIGQAVSVAHMIGHAPHAAVYAAKAAGLDGSGEVDRMIERDFQWSMLSPELRVIGFPKGR